MLHALFNLSSTKLATGCGKGVFEVPPIGQTWLHAWFATQGAERSSFPLVPSLCYHEVRLRLTTSSQLTSRVYPSAAQRIGVLLTTAGRPPPPTRCRGRRILRPSTAGGGNLLIWPRYRKDISGQHASESATREILQFSPAVASWKG